MIFCAILERQIMVTKKALISVRKLCFEFLKVRKEELISLAADRESYYRPYTQQTEKDGKTKEREIEPSFGYLKKVQRRIDRKIFKKELESLPPEIVGGRKGFSVVDNAKIHLESEAIMKYDVSKFFPSITEQQVFEIFRYRFGMVEEAANILKLLTTFDGHVPQGAPTSTSLAIFALEPTCLRLKKYCEANHLKFSIWIDDVTISGAKVQLVKSRGAINNILRGSPFKINPDKDTGILQKGSKKPRSVTGVITDNNGRMTIGRRRLHALQKQILHKGRSDDRSYGRLLFLKQVNPKQAKKLMHQFIKNKDK